MKTCDLAGQIARLELKVKKIVLRLVPISKVFHALNHYRLLNTIGQILSPYKNERNLMYRQLRKLKIH